MRCSDFDAGDDGERFVFDLLYLLILFFVRCLQTLDWRSQGLTSQQVEAKIAALSQSQCEQVQM